MKYQTTPLAERLRPTSLDQYIGQEHLVGENAVLRRAIESGRSPSMIFWGPPGVGKTTLASIISSYDVHFDSLYIYLHYPPLKR